MHSKLQMDESSIASTGILDLSCIDIDSLSFVGSQESLKELRLNCTSLKSLDSLQMQPNLEEITSNHSKIEALSGLDMHPKLSRISLIDTPVSETKYFRLAALIMTENRLTSINRVVVTDDERRMSKEFPTFAKQLINAGWAVTYPPPSEMDFVYLANKFNVEIPTGATLTKSNCIDAHEENNYHVEGFNNEVAELLRQLGFPIRCGEKMNDDIIKSVSDMCDTVKKIEEMKIVDKNI